MLKIFPELHQMFSEIQKIFHAPNIYKMYKIFPKIMHNAQNVSTNTQAIIKKVTVIVSVKPN